MPQVKDWLEAFRLRTLPLALSSIIAGGAMALSTGKMDWTVLNFCIITTIFLQILSNLANDYGDALKGTDNDQRLGPERSIQSGRISALQMKNAIIFFVLLSLASGISLLIFASKTIGWQLVLLFFLLGIAAILAAIKYTAGKGAYGYSGFGDIFVFLFFGVLGVSGTAFLISGEWSLEYLYIGSTIGCWSAGVLNLNNLRDHENDLSFNKRTIPVRIGFKKGKQYHFALILIGMLSSLGIIIGKEVTILNLIFLFSFIPIALHLKRFNKISQPKDLDPELKKLALSTFLFALLLFVANI